MKACEIDSVHKFDISNRCIAWLSLQLFWCIGVKQKNMPIVYYELHARMVECMH